MEFLFGEAFFHFVILDCQSFDSYFAFPRQYGHLVRFFIIFDIDNIKTYEKLQLIFDFSLMGNK